MSMSMLTLELIEKAVAQNPHQRFHESPYSKSEVVTQLAKAISKQYPEVSLFGCVILGFGLETLDKTKKPASNNVINSLETEDADCSHGSSGIGLGNRFLCEFGIVDGKQWGVDCKQHLVSELAKKNLRCTYTRPPELDELAIIGNSDSVSEKWAAQVLGNINAQIQADILAAATPSVSHSSSGPRL
jgi:hypothetical protein